jgi:16S rRNA (guanine527-N7)-methyltransferase
MSDEGDFRLARDAARITALAHSLGHDLAPAAARTLGSFVELVARWNRKLDLIGARSVDAQLEVLLADALVLADPALVTPSARVLDVGSGAGAPIIPLLLLRDDVSATLVEPLQKRAAFLRTSLTRLGLLARSEVQQKRVDPAAPAPEHGTDIALSRATFAPERWLPLGLALAPSTLVLLADALPPVAPAGARLWTQRDYRLPWAGAPRRVALYRRV